MFSEVRTAFDIQHVGANDRCSAFRLSISLAVLLLVYLCLGMCYCRLVENLKFEVVVFDTAPTGHTLRFLSVPMTLSKGMAQLMSMKDKMSGLLSGLMGQDMGSMEGKLEESRKSIELLSKQFKDPNLTSFVCVCIPEFLSMYETERLVQELAKYEIDVTNIIVNQVLYPEIGSICGLCNARSRMQHKYISQIDQLYQDFHVLKLPLLRQEVRGVEGPDGLKQFSSLMLNPYEEKWKQEKDAAASSSAP